MNRFILWLIPVALLIMAGYLKYRQRLEKEQFVKDIQTKPYGVRKNKLRESLHIPIIENDMQPEYNDDSNLKPWDSDIKSWHSEKSYPAHGQLLHSEKELFGFKDRYPEERDEFRLGITDSVFEQLGIQSFYQGDTNSHREGVLHHVKRGPTAFYDKFDKPDSLSEHGIDSVAKKWHLDYLVKGK